MMAKYKGKENAKDQMVTYKQHLVKVGRKNSLFNRKPTGKPGSGRSSFLLSLLRALAKDSEVEVTLNAYIPTSSSS